jgi:LmbE family N-acetylglucosaminyl deacetylase
VKILYIFPHPDDESFGTAHVMARQKRQEHEVYLLTLTRGGATRQRHKYNYSIKKMGEVRFQEMQAVAQVLALDGMTVLDLPDSGLKEMDPRHIEAGIGAEIERIRPQVVVTYAVHGISGFFDHLVCHAVVKRVFVEMRESLTDLQRLAFATVTEEEAKKITHFHLKGSKSEDIDCVVEVTPEDIQKAHQALDCYVTFQETIEKTGIKDFLSRQVPFEIFQEDFTPPIKDLFQKLPS